MKIIMYLLISIFLYTLFNYNAFAFTFQIISQNPNLGDDYIALGIYDKDGKYSGYDIKNPDNFIRNSLGFMPYTYAAQDDPDTQPIHNSIIGKTNVGIAGLYKIVVYGQRLSLYNLRGYIYENNMPRQSNNINILGLIDIGQIKYYEMNYTPMQNPVITRIAISTDLIADITTAQKLNLIGNPKFVSELTKEINEIEAEKAKGKVDDGLTPAQKAKKEYAELLKEITEKYNKPESDEFVKKEAYDVLKEDIEYIIGHL